LFQSFQKLQEIALKVHALREKVGMIRHQAVRLEREPMFDCRNPKMVQETAVMHSFSENMFAIFATEGPEEELAPAVTVCRQSNVLVVKNHYRKQAPT
jgi:hypothetical protein